MNRRLIMIRNARGFTLLEIMAVIVIIGIVLTFMTLSTGGDNRAEQMQREAQRLLELLELASDEAVMRSEQLALRVGENDYEFMILEGNQWLPLSDDRPLRPRQLPKGIELRLELDQISPVAFPADLSHDILPASPSPKRVSRLPTTSRDRAGCCRRAPVRAPQRRPTPRWP